MVLDQKSLTNTQNRVSVFPFSKGGGDTRLKRPLDDLDSVLPETKETVHKLQKARHGGFASLSKGAYNPWERYQKSFKLHQAGPSWIVHTKDASFSEGIIKEITGHKSDMARISASQNDKLVLLREAIYNDAAIFLVYEIMDVSLAQIFNSPLGRLQLFEVAAFTRELLAGVDYIHKSLGISHGGVSSTSVLLSVSGAVKIANIGTSMVENTSLNESQKDLEGIGNIIIECLEPITFLRGGRSLLSDWGSDVSDFVECTRAKPVEMIMKHDFLQLSPGPSCLKPYIRLARESAAKQVEVNRL